MQGINKVNIDEVRTLLRKSDEYRKKHPEAHIPPTVSIKAPKITNGTDLASLILNADAHQINHDEPENETEVAFLTEFLAEIEDADILLSEVPHEKPRLIFTFTQQIKALEACGFYVYGALTKGKYRTAFTTIDNFRVMYLLIKKRNTNYQILVVEPPNAAP